MLKGLLLAVVVFLGGCAGPVPRGALTTKPNQAEAQTMAWQILGGIGEPPVIYWVEGARLDCADIPGLAWQVGSSDCHRGETHDGEDWSDVAYPDGLPLSDGPQVQPGHGDWTGTSMVHEMAHHLGVDPIHTGPLYVIDGPVDQANAALRERGW